MTPDVNADNNYRAPGNTSVQVVDMSATAVNPTASLILAKSIARSVHGMNDLYTFVCLVGVRTFIDTITEPGLPTLHQLLPFLAVMASQHEHQCDEFVDGITAMICVVTLLLVRQH